MCQRGFYHYKCTHHELVTFPCDKNRCRHFLEPFHTYLLDLCHDCTELGRQKRQERGRRESCQDLQPPSRPQSQMQMHGQQQQSAQGQGQTQAHQSQARQDPQSSSPDSKGNTIRPLETDKLANMDCRLEGTFGLTPSEVYRFYRQLRM